MQQHIKIHKQSDPNNNNTQLHSIIQYLINSNLHNKNPKKYNKILTSNIIKYMEITVILFNIFFNEN